MTTDDALITTDDVLRALRWEYLGGRWVPPDMAEMERNNEHPILAPKVPPFFDPGPDGAATMHEFERAVAERCWVWEKRRGNHHSDFQPEILIGPVKPHTFALAFVETTVWAACWEAFVKADRTAAAYETAAPPVRRG